MNCYMHGYDLTGLLGELLSDLKQEPVPCSFDFTTQFARWSEEVTQAYLPTTP